MVYIYFNRCLSSLNCSDGIHFYVPYLCAQTYTRTNPSGNKIFLQQLIYKLALQWPTPQPLFYLLYFPFLHYWKEKSVRKVCIKTTSQYIGHIHHILLSFIQLVATTWYSFLIEVLQKTIPHFYTTF